MSIAFGLLRERVENILVLDENPLGYEGPWRTFARMLTLRTPKYLTGPDLGIPNLTMRAWYEAQFGREGWEKLIFLPKELWSDYLLWYRRVLDIPVENNTKAGAIEWSEKQNCFIIPVSPSNQENDNGTSKEKVLYARKVVLATGIDGSGSWEIPSYIKDNLPPELFAHTRDNIDFEKLRGKKIAVLGAGASAFDNASTALETEAKEVHLFFRRDTLPNINPYRWAEFVGFLKHHGDLTDAQKWKFILKILRMGQLPPADTLKRASSFPNFFMHSGSPWQKVEAKDNKAIVTTPKGTFEFDFLIIGTGFVTNLNKRPELSNLVDKIALWQDRYQAPQEAKHEDLSRHPYLGPCFEMQEKVPGEAPYLNSLFNYTFGCLLSLGFGGAAISGMKYSLPRIIGGITKQIYFDDAKAFYESLETFDEREY